MGVSAAFKSDETMYPAHSGAQLARARNKAGGQQRRRKSPNYTYLPNKKTVGTRTREWQHPEMGTLSSRLASSVSKYRKRLFE